MIKRLTYKSKIYLLWLGFFLMLLLSYFISIKATIGVVNDCSFQETQLNMLEDAPKVIRNLEEELSEIEIKIGKVETNGNDFQKVLLQEIGKYCETNQVVLIEFPEKVSFNNDDFKIETYTLVVGGKFIDILRLVYLIEQQIKLGKVVSLIFERKENLVSGKISLKARIIIQHICKV